MGDKYSYDGRIRLNAVTDPCPCDTCDQFKSCAATGYECDTFKAFVDAGARKRLADLKRRYPSRKAAG